MTGLVQVGAAQVTRLVEDPGRAEVRVVTDRVGAVPLVHRVGDCPYHPDVGPDLTAAVKLLDAAGWLVIGAWTELNSDLSSAPVAHA